MNEEEIVRIFLQNGFQISKNALPLIIENPEHMLSELKKMKPRPFIVSEQHIKNIQKPTKIKPVETRFIKEYIQERGPVSVKDYLDFFISRYEELKKIISSKMGSEKLISINKIAMQTMMCSVIGIVREKNRNNILVEDSTGEVYVFFDESFKEKFEEIILDEVIGISIKKIKDKYYAKNVIFPDVPTNREINKTEKDTILAVVSTSSNLDETKYKNLLSILTSTENLSALIFFDDNVNVTNDFSKFNPLIPKQNPSLFQFENIKFLILPKKYIETLTFDFKTSDSIILMLKKRHLLCPCFPKSHDNRDDFVLTEIPDIIISNFGETVNKNYKGTTIISNSDPNKIFLINLKTRAVTEKLL